MSRSLMFIPASGATWFALRARLMAVAGVIGLVGGLLGLAGCNETGGALAGPQTSVAATGSTFRLPPGAPCSGEINRFQEVVKGDLATGNVEQKIYDQIEGDLNRAAGACSAGRGGDAHSIVAASKARHGYRA